jgi:peptidoglycan/xylan/chitin deacetylase (PgdA/CDA1 family)
MTHDVDLISRVSTPGQALRSLRTALADKPATSRERVVRAARPGVRAARALYNGISRAPDADTLERSVALERKRGVSASYFFTVYPGAQASRYDCIYDFEDACRFRGERMSVAEVVRTLDAEGFDVGLHGSYNSALAPGLLERERAALERACGVSVSTTRQHFVHWDIRTTPQLQAGAGFSADSTLGYNRNLGYRAGTSLPFRFFDLERQEQLDLLQVPLLLHDGALLRPDALELDVDLAREVIRQFVDTAAETNGVATMIFHPNNLERDDYLELYSFALDYGLERSAWFVSLRDLDRWWRERERRLAAR